MTTFPHRIRCSIRRPTASLAMAFLAIALASCSRQQQETQRATDVIADGKFSVVGARPAFAPGTAPTTGGFLESVRWDESIETLQCKGWAPVDVRGAGVRFVLRDPHDRLRLEGTPIFSAQARADVAKAHPRGAELLHSGFTASIRLTNRPAHDHWTEALELYCLDATGALFRLARVEAPTRQSWDRRADRFEIALMYADPVLTVPEKTQGSLDFFESGPSPGTVSLAGWAPFDGQSPQSVLIVQLSPSLAPASILSIAWVPRPDVRAAVDPSRAELDRCGFEMVLRVDATLDDLRRTGALQLWAIDGHQQAVRIGLPALRAGK